MTAEYPLLASIDPHQQRIGYIGALSLVATRDYSTRDAITSRLKDLLYRKVYHDEPLFNDLLERVHEWRRPALLEIASSNATDTDLSPASILAAPDRRQPWLTINTFWINDHRMPSTVGELVEEKAFRIVDLARMLGVLLPGHDLSENGYLLKYLLEDINELPENPLNNPLIPNLRPALQVLYLRLLLESDVLFPFIIRELVKTDTEGRRFLTRGKQGLLLASVDALLATIGTATYPDEILAIQNINKYRNAISRNQSTQENYLRPRLEMLVDVGYLTRRTGTGTVRNEFVWTATPATRALAAELQPCLTKSASRETLLDAQFFGALARTQEQPYTAVRKQDAVLLHFAKAINRIKRDFGFTPGRTGALLACLLAWENHEVIEITQVFDAVYNAAKSDLNKYLHFSGGSRFDREFLIRLDDGLVAHLEQRLHGAP
jgi:hypothetical protein